MKRFSTIVCALLAGMWLMPAHAEYVGDFAVGTDNICKIFNTYRPSTGAAFTAASLAVDVYKDDNVTQDNDSGLTVDDDFDALTGAHQVCVDTSTDATFYSAGSMFTVVVSVGTVDSVSIVGTEAMTFSLAKANVSTGTVTTATNVTTVNGLAANVITAASIATDAFGAAEAAADLTTELQTGLATAASLTTVGTNVATLLEALTVLGAEQTADSGTTTTAVDAALTQATNDWFKGVGIHFTSGTLLGQDACVTGFTAASDTLTFAPAVTTAVTTHTYYLLPNAECVAGDTYTRLGAPAGASIAADVQAVEDETDDIGVAGAGLTNIDLPNQTMDIAGTLTTVTTAGTATNVTTVNGLAANVITAAAIATDAIGATEVADGAIDAATLATDTITAAKIAADAIAASELAADAIGASEVADNALDEAAFSQAAGTFESLGIIDQGTAQSATSTTLVLRAAAAFADDEIIGAKILTTGGSAGVGQAKVITDYVSATDTATVSTWQTTPTGTITYMVFAEPAGSGGAVSISAGGITASSFASGAIDAAAIATDAIGAAEVATDAIGAAEIATDAIGAAEIAAAAIAASEIATDAIGAAEVADDSIDAGAIANNALDEAAFSQAAGSFESLGIVDQGTAQAATATTLQLRSAAAFADDEIIGAHILITGGSAGVGQTKAITDYVSSTDTATVSTWQSTPTGTITYMVFKEPAGSAGSVSISAGGITASSFASGAIDAAAIATDAIGAAELAADAIGSSEVATDALGAAEIATDAIGAAELATDAITATEIAAAAIGSSELATDAITSAEIADDSIDAGALAASAIGASEIATDAIGAAEAAADLTTELQTGLATAASLTTVDDFVDDLESRLGTPIDLGIGGATIADNLQEIESQTDDIGAAGAGLTAADDAVIALVDDIGVAGAGLTAADDAVMTRLGTPAGASVSADIAEVEGETDDIGVAGAGLTAADDATLTAVDAVPTNAELSTALAAADDATLAAIAALNNLSAAQLRDLVIEDQGGGVSLGCAIAVVLAYASGDVTTVASVSTYKEPSGTETRTTGTVASSGNRAASITCPSY